MNLNKIRGAASAALLFFVVGCAGVTPDLKSPKNNPNSIFKRDLQINVNGVAYEGVGVIPKSASYSMTITSRVDVDIFSVTSCHRDVETKDAIDVTWIKPKRSYVFKYVPVAGIEDIGSCMVRIAALNKDNAASAFGLYDFETDFEKLPASLTCNGVKKDFNGVSICQGRSGLIQTITFPVPVKIDNTDTDCVPYEMKTKDNLTFEYLMPSGECVLYAREIEKPNRFHRHTNFGYNDYITGVEK